MRINIIKEKKYGDCKGSIYIDLIHEASEIICSPQILNEFCSRFFKEIYGEVFHCKKELYLCFNEASFYFNDLNANYMGKDFKWYRIYENNGSQFADEIEVLAETTKRTVFDGWSFNCANIYGSILKELCNVILEPTPLQEFAEKLYDVWENKTTKKFYITANASNYYISDKPNIKLEDRSYGFENHYYLFSVNEFENASLVELTIESEGEKANE